MQRGASDYVLKDNLRRLRPAIERALDAARREREGRRMQLALRESEERFRSLVETTEEWIWEVDLQRRNVYSNASVMKMIGHSAESIRGRDFAEMILPEDRQAVLALLPQCIAGRHGWQNVIKRWVHADGSVRMIESSAQPVLDEAGQVRGFRGMGRDVTLREQQARKIAQLARIEAVLSAHGNAVLRARDANELLDVTCRVAVEQGGFLAAVIGRERPALKLTMTNWFGDPAVIAMIAGLGPADLDGEDAPRRPSARVFSEARRIVTPEYSRSDAAPELRAAMARVGVESQVALPIGSPPWAVLGLFLSTAQQADEEEISLLERLTAQIDYAQDFIAKSERLEYLAYHNPVTGLPNRTSFGEQIGARVERSAHVVAMVDIDRFRYFNQSRGRTFGDHLLTAVGTRLRAAMPSDALFAHPGDDCFVFAYPSDETLEQAVLRVEGLLHACCEKQVMVDGEEVQVSLHASVLLAPTHADSAESIERALVAVLAESQGSERPVLAFTEEVRARASARADLERDLRVALATEAFELYLQPKFNAASQRLVGAEALLRWRHPEHGLVSPAQFIPALEETGMVIDVGAWVRRRGLEIWKRWDQQGHAGLRIAVNVSARELRHSAFVPECAALLDPFMGEHGLDIEITESMLMDDIGKSVQVLQSLRELGCKIAIDDFGTGYSSLNYLSRLPADALKIDQSFTNALALSPDTLSLVTNIIGLAHSLGLTVVAEGVEEEEQAKLLRLLRCDQLQGYHLGRPMPVDEFEKRYLS
jgi:PAS domain S-box-containing protein/diguanylate cyclase (GGDEF)-like protein